MALKPIEICDEEKSFSFLQREVANKVYLYNLDTCLEMNDIANPTLKYLSSRVYAWVLGVSLLFANIVMNIARLTYFPALKLQTDFAYGKDEVDEAIRHLGSENYSVPEKLQKVIYRGNDRVIAHRLWEKKTPYKAIIGLVVQFVLNLLSALTFGVFSHHFNHLSGDIERWISGDTHEEINSETRNRRSDRSSMVARCQQPLFVIDKLYKGSIEVSEMGTTNKIKACLQKIIKTQIAYISLSNVEYEEDEI